MPGFRPDRLRRAKPDRARSMQDFNTLQTILQSVCARFKIKPNDLAGHCRQWKVVWPRCLAIYLLRSRTSYSFSAIGELFENRHHTSIFQAARTCKDELDTNADARADLSALESILDKS